MMSIAVVLLGFAMLDVSSPQGQLYPPNIEGIRTAEQARDFFSNFDDYPDDYFYGTDAEDYNLYGSWRDFKTSHVDILDIDLQTQVFDSSVVTSYTQTRLTAKEMFVPESFVELASQIGWETFEEGFEYFFLPDMPIVSIEAESQLDNRSLPLGVAFTVQPLSNSSTFGKAALKFKDKLVASAKHSCSYFEPKRKMFSTKGCRNIGSTASQVSCRCNHTTIFAVMLSVRSYSVPQAVKISTWAAQSITIVSLIATFCILVSVRKDLNSDRLLIQMNLVSSLLFFHLVSVFHDLAQRNDAGCRAVAVMLHYFLLSTCVWMVVEGATLLIKTGPGALKYNSYKPRNVATVQCSLGWGLPLLAVAISAGVGLTTETYMNKNALYKRTGQSVLPKYNKCWLDNDSMMLLLGAIIPVGAMFLINLCVMVKVVLIVGRLKAEARDLQPPNRDRRDGEISKAVGALKVAGMLFPVLGIPYAVSFLANIESYEASVACMYANVAVNGLQGAAVLLVYCVFNENVRESVAKRRRKAKLGKEGRRVVSDERNAQRSVAVATESTRPV